MNNYRFVKNGEWGDFLNIESDRLIDYIEYIKKNNIKLIAINYYNGYKLKDISFIREISHLVEGLIVVQGDVNLAGIETLNNLKMLNISDEQKYFLDFSFFRYLERCSLLWHKNYKNLNQCKQLKELLLKKFKYEKKETSLFNRMDNLKSLTFIQPIFEDLDIIQNLPALNTFEIYYAPKLKNIDGLLKWKKSIKRLIIDHCKNIASYEVLGKLTELEFLGINDSKDLESFSFIRNLSNLNHLSFVGTNVIDGDLSFCIGIKHVGFNNKKHYTHTYEELNKK